MMTVSAVTRNRLEAQGFVGLDDATLSNVGPWLRLSPAICLIWAAIGTVLASPVILFSLMPFAAIGAAFPWHPFDAIYNHGLRHWLGTPRLPPYRAPKRFECAVATIWLGAAGLAFDLGSPGLGYVLGGSLTLAALVPVTTDFCIPSFFWGLFFGKPLRAEEIDCPHEVFVNSD